MTVTRAVVPECEVVDSKLVIGGVDALDELKRWDFTLGLGGGSINYFTKAGDLMIYKTRPLSEIKNFDGLHATIYDFVNAEPKDGEMFDISKEAIQQMKERYAEMAAKSVKINAFERNSNSRKPQEIK